MVIHLWQKLDVVIWLATGPLMEAMSIVFRILLQPGRGQALPPDLRGNAGLCSPGDDGRGWRILFGPGRGQRGRGGEVFRLDSY